MALSADDRIAITDLINRHGHLTDTLVLTPSGWRIARRVVTPRRKPLQG
jgi:hypothetical protein